MNELLALCNMDYVNAVFIFFILYYLGISIKKVNDHIEAPAKILDSLCEIESLKENLPSKARELLLNQYDNVSKSFKECGNKEIEHQWREFEEQIIHPNGDTILYYMNTLPPSSYFDEDAIIGEKFSLRHMDGIASKLTGIGILGTFFGLTIGISSATLALGVDANDINALGKAIEQLLSGAGTAFMTSLVGLLSSMIFSFYEKRSYGHFTDKLSDFLNSLERCLEFYTVEKNNLRVLDENIKQTRALNDLGNQMAEAFDNAITEKLSVPMKNFSSGIESQLEAIKVANEESSKNISTSMAELVTGGTGGENFDRARESAHSALEALANTMQTSLTDLVDKQGKMGFLIESAIQKMNEQMTSGAENYQSTMNQSLQDLTISINDLVENMKEQLSKSIVEMSQGVSESQKEAFSDFENSTSKVTDMVTSLARKNTDFTEDLVTKTNRSFNSINQDITSTVASMKDGFIDTLNNVTEETSRRNKELSERFNSGIENLSSSVKGLNSSTTQMSTSVNEFNLSIPALKEPSSELKEAIVSFRIVSEALRSSSERITDASQVVNQNVNSSKQIAESVSGTIEIVNEANKVLKEVWTNYDERFAEADKGIENVVLNLTNGINSLSDISGKHVSELASQMNKITSLLSGAIEELSESIEEKK